MAGQPRKRAMILDLERRTREHFEDNEHTVLDYVEAWTENGDTLVKLADDIAESAAEGKDLTPAQITRYLNSTFGEVQVKARLDLARQRGAHMLVERRQEDISSVTDKDDVPAEKLRNDMSIWLAGKWNRAELGEQRANVQVQVNVGQLHLDAMRLRNVEEQAKVTADAADVVMIESAAEREIE